MSSKPVSGDDQFYAPHEIIDFVGAPQHLRTVSA